VVRFSRTFAAEDVAEFGRLTRDYNPVHCEPRFCAAKGFRAPIAHGLLVGSMICEAGGQWAWLASGMEFEFLKPAYVGATVTCEVRVLEVGADGRASAEGTFTGPSGEVIGRVRLRGFLPAGREREVLSAMIAEGDPTNPLRDER
jgi:acyl dehydratase